jgi:ABC-type uncharacterized transport system fused permease/ATPase subunit
LLQTRLRSNAESVAFYRGVSKEGELIRASFKDMLHHQARVLGKQWRFGMVQVGGLVARLAACWPPCLSDGLPDAAITGPSTSIPNHSSRLLPAGLPA